MQIKTTSKKTAERTQQRSSSTTKISEPHNSSSIDTEQSSSNSSSSSTEDATLKSKINKARMALYEAGIDSSSISDNELLKYWNTAHQKKINFVKYIESILSK
ncbi:hypothetical protein BMS84_08320 [Leuconostoc pseudomesenteroides]|nr:hypothetical protein BMS84_08320 [Leuconostoc pseudomesenteroides]